MSAIEAARLSLEGLSVGDAFGERFFRNIGVIVPLIEARTPPPGPWMWTDDTAMGLSIVDVLEAHGHIDRDALARAFARRYQAEPRRGYGGTAHVILHELGQGIPWQTAAGRAFGGQGSMGNGAAMRAAPIGAFFAAEPGSYSPSVILDKVVQNARASAEPTHAHPDGQAGAIAVAVAAAVVHTRPSELLAVVAEHTPAGPTRDGIEHARQLPFSADVATAVKELGNGENVISSDTVPFALWCAARHVDDYVAAMWTTVSGLGDRDTTCAIAGGVVAAAVGWDGIPAAWRAAREPLSGG